MDVYNLVLETTRRCNFQCEHCMRGDAQPKDMTPEVVDAVLRDVDYIRQVTFTGGEPSLPGSVTVIRYFLERCKALEIPIDAFYIATNGGPTSHSDAFIRILLDLYLYCDDKYICAVDVSNSVWHAAFQESEDLGVLGALRFVSKRRELDERSVLMVGRAVEYGIGGRVYNIEKWDPEYPEDATFYITVDGGVMPDCNLSYEQMEEEIRGNILQDSLQTIYDRETKLKEAV